MYQQEPKFYCCSKCHAVFEKIDGKNEESPCCEMPLLVPNESEGAQEKHLPVIEQRENRVTVQVGSTAHPMTEEHSIRWIYLQTKRGCQRINLNSEPTATFLLGEGDAPIAAYAYCNLHGFWKTTVS